MVNNQYVKFVKGTLSAYERCSKDPNTLYFITDSNGDISLYLGTDLISSSNTKEEIINLTQLVDVTLKTKIEPNSILVYNDSNSQWEDVTLEDLSALLNIPTSEDIQEIAENVVAGVINDAPEAFDTLKEIADWIKEDETGTEALITRVGNLETLTQTQSNNITNLQTSVGDLTTLTQTQSTNISNLQTAVEGLEDIINGLTTGGDVDLAGYVKTSEFVATVGNLSDLIREEGAQDPTNLVKEINDINARISWQTLEEI